MVTYTHDNQAPADPTYSSSTPASPSTGTTPAIVGAASADTATVKLYSNVACTTQIGTGTKAAFEGAGLTATVGSNATTTIYAKAFDASSNGSACVSMTSFISDSLAPNAPAYTAFTPVSPSSNAAPDITGTSSADTVTVKFIPHRPVPPRSVAVAKPTSPRRALR